MLDLLNSVFAAFFFSEVLLRHRPASQLAVPGVILFALSLVSPWLPSFGGEDAGILHSVSSLLGSAALLTCVLLILLVGFVFGVLHRRRRGSSGSSEGGLGFHSGGSSPSLLWSHEDGVDKLSMIAFGFTALCAGTFLLLRVSDCDRWLRHSDALRVLLAFASFSSVLFWDVRRHQESISLTEDFLPHLAIGLLRALPVVPVLAVAFGAVFMVLIILMDAVGVDPHWLNQAIYYGVIYGPFTTVYFDVKARSIRNGAHRAPQSDGSGGGGGVCRKLFGMVGLGAAGRALGGRPSQGCDDGIGDQMSIGGGGGGGDTDMMKTPQDSALPYFSK